MLKKITFLFLSFLLVVVSALLFVEFVLQVIPVVSKAVPVSKDKVYVYIIGESSSVGEPYDPKISYYKILGYIIGDKINNKNIDFIKIAGAGQGVDVQYWNYLIYRYTHPFKKGLAFIYAGKNSWDNGIRDKNYLTISKIKIFNLIKNSLLKNLSFEYNYEKLISVIESFGDEIVVATIEGNYAGFMPHLDADNILYKEEFDKIDDEILINKDYEKAKILLKELEEKEDSDKSWICYRYGKIAEFTAKNKEANDYYIEGVGFYGGLIPAKYQIDCIRNLAKKYNLPLVDIFEKIYDSGEIIGFNFYKDNQHPDIKLYITIAELFAKALKEKYGPGINIEKNNVTEKDVCEYFGFNDKDMYDVYRRSLDVTLVHSKENDNVNRYVFKKVDEYLNKITEMNPYEGEHKQAIISFYGMMTEALKGNKDRMFEIYKENKDIIEKNKYDIYARHCDWEEYNKWVSSYLGIKEFFDLSKR